jgi:predicted dehydrogenase
LKRGIHVVTEKPMTTDAEKCKAILRTVKETGNHLTVTFVSRQKSARKREELGVDTE